MEHPGPLRSLAWNSGPVYVSIMEAMTTRLPVIFLLMAALAPATRVQAQDAVPPAPLAPPPPPSSATTPAAGNGAALTSLFAAPVAAPAPTPARTARALSPELATVLASGMPKYDPPKPVDASADTSADAPDARDAEKPKNEIRRLPKYVVRAPRPLVFRERDLYNEDGLEALAMKRYTGLGLVPFPSWNSKIAEQMYWEQDRLNNISDLVDTARAMARGGASDEGQYILRATQDTYRRDATWGWNGPNGATR